MAITSITGIANSNRVAAFSDVPVTVVTNNASAILIQVEYKVGSTVLATEFSNVFLVGATRLARMNLRGSLSSLMATTANVVAASEPDGGDIATNMTDHYKKIDIVFSEFTTVPVNPSTVTNVVIYKAVELNFDADHDFIAFEPNDCTRTAFKDEYIYPTVFKQPAGDVVMEVTEILTVTQEQVDGFAQFRIKCEDGSIYNDFYLPSINELVQIYTNLYLNTIGGYDTVEYWSSTQNDISSAKAFNFNLGASGISPKSDAMAVIPVRHFTSATPIALGERGQAGFVFYRDGTKHYEALPNKFVTDKQWGLETNNIAGTLATIGSGANNTTLIAAVETGKAANYCKGLTVDTKTIELTTDNDSNKVTILVDTNVYPRRKTLHFINKYGGWDFYNVIDYEEVTRVEKSQYTRYSDHFGSREIAQFIGNRVREVKCYGRAGRAEFLKYIEGLVTSPVVMDEEGNRVRVLDTSILTDSQGILEPEFTIQYLEENTINY